MGNFTIYNASAGSGKTTTLAAEFLALALKSENADNYRAICAITFTNKAAAEMKERVLTYLKLFSTKNWDNGELSSVKSLIQQKIGVDDDVLQKRAEAVLKHVLHHYSLLTITTIDKFVQKIVRPFVYDLGLPPSYEIELDQSKILKESIDLLMTEAGINAEITDALLQFMLYQAEQEKSIYIDEKLKNIAFPIFQEEAYPYITKLSKFSLHDFSLLKKLIFQKKHDFESKVLAVSTEAIQLIQSNGLEMDDFSYKSNGSICAYFYGVQSGQYIRGTSNIFKSIDKGKLYSNETKAEIIDGISEQLISYFTEVNEHIESNHAEYKLIDFIERNLYSIALINEINYNVQKWQSMHNAVPISAFTKLINNLIKQESVPYIYERIGERYKHYLIDEFQDTSIMQWENFLPLIENSLAESYFNMIVGDPKQSIYRWRAGDVEQFLQLIFLPEQGDKANKALQINHSLKSLAVSYRSQKTIVEFNNRFFTDASKLSSNTYIEQAYSDLHQEYLPSKKQGYVYVEYQTEFTDKEAAYTYQLNKTISIVNELQADNFPLRDIAILVRKNAEGVMLAKALLEKGIHVISSESLLLKTSLEVQFLQAILKWVVFPNDSILRADVLIKMHNLKLLTKPLHQCLQDIVDDNKANERLEHYLFENNIELSKQQIQLYSAVESVKKLCKYFNFNTSENLFLSFYIDFFIEQSRIIGQSLRNSILVYEEKQNSLSIKSPEGADAVSILSIHQSKGLGFEVVIFAFANWSLMPQMQQYWLDDIHSEIPIPMQVNLSVELSKAEHNLEKERQKAYTKLDLLNLLYVAFTRAKERMYVLGYSYKSAKFMECDEIYKSVIMQYNEWNVSENFIVLGEKKPNTKKYEAEKKVNLATSSTSKKGYAWRSKMQELLRPLNPDKEEQLAVAAEYGKLIHSIFAQLSTLDEVDEIIKNISESDNKKFDLRNIKQQIAAIIIQLDGCFEKDVNSYNEREILSPNGKLLRPDRIVLKENQSILIDYKTGAYRESHVHQVREYLQLLQEMNFPNPIAKLAYIDEARVVEVGL